MPESTPIYGFTYPCPDETVGPLAFSTLANQIDSKLTELRADEIAALNRRNSDTAQVGYQNIPNTVETALTSPDTMYTVTEAGVYVVRAVVRNNPAGSPTITGWRARIRQNGVSRFGFSHSTPNNNVNPLNPTGVMVAAVGDVFSVVVLFTGAGTMDVAGSMQVKLITRIA